MAFIPATVSTLSVCCVCKHVAEPSSSSHHWTPMSTYLERHKLNVVDVQFSHTYCPLCYEQQAKEWALPFKKPSVGVPPKAA